MTHTRSHRSIQIALSLLAAAFVVLAFAPASQAKVVVDAFGFTGPQGGHLNEPAGIAINQTGAGGVPPGTLYVSDVTEGVEGTDANRIQRLDPEGHFERLWGFNVVGSNEIQTVTITFGAKGGAALDGTVGGSFALTLGTDTAEFTLDAPPSNSNMNPSRQAVQSGLEALPSIGAGNVRVSGGLDDTRGGGAFEIEFLGVLGGADVAQLLLDGSQIQGPAPISATISTLQDGFGGPFAGFEICTVASECKRGAASPTTANGGQLSSPGAIAVDQSTGNVYVVNNGDRRIEEFDANGNFLRAWGWDVVSTGGTGDVSTNAFEVCTVAVDCKKGAESSSGGSVGFAQALAFDSSGNLWITDPANHRFEEFEPDGSFIAAYGWDVDALGGSGELEKCTSTVPGACNAGTKGTALGQFGGNFSGPGVMAIDSSDYVYAIDPNNKRIERFDPGMTTATLFTPELFEETGLSGFGQNRILALPSGDFLLSAGQSGEYRLFELDHSGHLLETSLAGDGLPEARSLARNESTGTIYATVYNPGKRPGVAVIGDGPVTLPTAAIDPVTNIGAEEATFNASVDPLGKPVADCKFQYSTDQVEWKDLAEPDCATLDLEAGTQPLSQVLGGLEPGTHYFVRFTASRYYHNEPVLTAEVEFTTPSAPPLVFDVGAAQITDTSAYLAGEVKPRSQSSEYHFAYGTTPALGSSTSTVGLTGPKQQIVSQQVAGLQPDTTYYLRLLATNVAATTPSPTVTFHTRPPEEVEQRAYEQVSPPDKNFSNADFGPERNAVAADGGAVAFCSTTGFGDPPGQIGVECTAYRAARTASGWRTRWLGEPYCATDLDSTGYFSVNLGTLPHFSPNFDFATIVHSESASCPLSPLDPAAPMPQANLYRADYRSEPISYDLLAPQPAVEPFVSRPGGFYAAASDDWSHLVYTSTGQQTPDAPAGNFEKAFEWHQGTLRLVSVDPAGTPFTASSFVPEDPLHGVSADGSRIFFMTPASEVGCESSTCELYMRQNGTKTYDVSQSECTSSCGSSAADEFLAATPSGAKAVFMSKAKLVNEDTADNGNDLYLYTHSANPAANKNLTLLSKDSEPADDSGAQVLGLLGISDDAETVYFVAKGQLVAGAPIAAGPKVYRWQGNGGSPTLDYLATLTLGDTGNWTGTGYGNARGDSREVTPDGKYLLIHTPARLDRGADHDSDRDVYRWSQADGWLCLSCQAPGSPSAGDSTFSASSGQGGSSAPNLYRNVISEDGRRVFFTSSDALLPGDTNERADLYEWHQDGTLTLISSGTDTTNVQFLGASRSGDDVFFTTYERLVGWDTDNNADIYDARVGGGFPEPPPTGAPCEGEACRGAPTTPPTGAGPGTPFFEGPGNQPPPKPCKKGYLRKHGKCVKKTRHRRHRHRAKANSNRGAHR